MVFLEELFHAMVAQSHVNLEDEHEGKTALRRAVEDVHDGLPFGQAAVAALIDAGANVNTNNILFFAVKNLVSLTP